MIKTLEEISLSKGEYGGGFSAVGYIYGSPRYIRITDITEDGKLTADPRCPSGNENEWSKYQLVEGDILFARSGATVGKTFLYENKYGDCVYAGYLIRFKPNKDIAYPKYVYYYTRTPQYKAWILNKQNVVAQPNINAKQYGQELKIPLPSLATQKKIASILDAADAYRQKTKALIEKYDELTQSLFLEMFGDPVTNPNNFPIVSLNDLCTKITDGEHGTVKRLSEGRLYLMARNIRENYIDLSDVSFIGEEDHTRIYKRCKAEKGDILLVCVGATIGRLCITPEMEEFSLARSVALLKPKADIVKSQFLYSALASDYIQGVIKRSGNSSAQAGLYTGKIKALEIPLPPIILQNQFAERVQQIETQKAQAQKSLEKAEELFNSLLQRAFKGELV